MIVNLWSTPRTGSTWYSLYLLNKLKENNSRTYLIKQYLNYVHLINYSNPKYPDFIYKYEEGSNHSTYVCDKLAGSLIERIVKGPRVRNHTDEEAYRLNLLDQIDCNKNTFLFHSHIQPMSKKSYDFMVSKAYKNIYLYRENFIDQISSYAIGYYTKNFYKINNDVNDVYVEEPVLEYLTERVIDWHRLDKSCGEVIRYEDLPFDQNLALPKKQNNFSKFDKLSEETKKVVLKLNDRVLKVL